MFTPDNDMQSISIHYIPMVRMCGEKTGSTCHTLAKLPGRMTGASFLRLLIKVGCVARASPASMNPSTCPAQPTQATNGSYQNPGGGGGGWGGGGGGGGGHFGIQGGAYARYQNLKIPLKH